MNAHPPDLAIVMISYNTREMTCAALASVFDQTHDTSFEIIVVDNASSDGSAQAIRDSFPNITVIEEQTNHGFGPAHKFALAQTRAPWVLLLNPDTLVLNGAIDRLFAFAQTTPENGIWGGRTLAGDGSLNPMSCFGRMTLWSTLARVLGLNALLRSSVLFNSELIGTWARDTVREVDIVSGCFFLIRRETWDRLGGFDDAFVMYGEETDLCLRARAAGLRPIITPEAEIIHYAGASETVRADKMVRLMRAKVELIKRHFHPVARWPGRWLFGLWPLSRRVATGVAGRLLGRPKLVEVSAVWAEIWARRAEWKDGYAPARD